MSDSKSACPTIPPPRSVRAASIRPQESHQLGNSFCSVTASLAKVRSNQAADMASTFVCENIVQPSQIAATAAIVTPMVSACIRRRVIQATRAMQQMLPTEAGMITNEIMNGSRSTK